MRCLNRNKQTLYYATYVSDAEITDLSGYKTGTYTITYSKPVKLSANVSDADGEVARTIFGLSLNYSKVILVEDIACPIAESSILWIDTMPTLSGTGTTTTPNDYIVKRVSKSLNSVAYAIAKVNVS